ncbi:hypothetical protein, partial [Pseudomonas sp. URIL14HWK12:I3]|uniref:hypothetical protein n=1 Tax=Pseudomonas sp. URIL14HWK12:I3 TaxID=1261631 RepID=UPI001C44EC2D
FEVCFEKLVQLQPLDSLRSLVAGGEFYSVSTRCQPSSQPPPIYSIVAFSAPPELANSLNLKEFRVPMSLEVGRIIRGFETASTFNFIYLKYSGRGWERRRT